MVAYDIHTWVNPCVNGRTYALLSCVHLAEIASRQERERERGPIALKYEWGLDAAIKREGHRFSPA